MSGIVDDLLYLSGQPRLKGVYGVEKNAPSLCEVLGVASLTIVCLQDELSRIRAKLNEPEVTRIALLAELSKLHSGTKEMEHLNSNVARCCKCGSEDIFAQYHSCKYDCVHINRRFDSEHLHKTCRNCGYEWPEKCLDAIEAAKEGGE